MVEKRTPISVAEAINKVMKFAKIGTKELVPLVESSGRYLAENLIADHDIPSFDRSQYDGFAIRAEDTVQAKLDNSTSFQVIGEIGAGSVFLKEVGKNEAVRIMTGAQIPQGCNAVVMLEHTRQFEKDDKIYIEIKQAIKNGENIAIQGEEIRKETVLVKKGKFINPGVSALLATFGYSQVPVAKKPVVGVIATGSELLDISKKLEQGKIRDSNTYMILSQIQRAGGEPHYFGRFNDYFKDCFTAVKNALNQVDILITTGGVSVGDYDYLPAIYKLLNAHVLYNKVAMRPGSVTTVAYKENKLLFGLSGNPSSCYVGFELFVRPIIRHYLYNDKPHLTKAKAILGENFSESNPYTRFVRGKSSYLDGKLFVSRSGFDKPSSVSSLGEANALIVLPGGTKGFDKGMVVDVLLLDDLDGSKEPVEIHNVE